MKLPNIFDKRNSLEPSHTSLISTEKTSQLGQYKYPLQFASEKHLKDSPRRPAKYPTVDLKVYESVIRDPITLKTRI